MNIAFPGTLLVLFFAIFFVLCRWCRGPDVDDINKELEKK